MKIQIPEYVQKILCGLTDAGYEAYVVGGCVRDVLMGKIPHDWDICTSALPEEICICFREFKTIDIGKEYGTIIVISENQPVEVTTYRIDGKYTDSRHPQSVSFTRSLKEDLARRDFTMNALAYNPKTGLKDYFGGEKAVEEKMIVAVGNPQKRFQEDALRILRGLRFAAVLDFKIEEKTEKALIEQAESIKNISAERIRTEFSKLITGHNADEILRQYKELLEGNIDGLKVVKINLLPQNIPCRLAALFPENTSQSLRKLRYDNKTIVLSEKLKLIKKENAGVNEKDTVILLKKYGPEAVQLWFKMINMEEWFTEILAKNPCYSLKQLAIGGQDLLQEGIPGGPEIGRILSVLLDRVIHGQVENNKEELLAFLRKEEWI